MSEILNANPTIRNVSDLPSRRREGTIRSSSKTPQGLFASTIPASAHLPDPFSPHHLDSDISDEEDDEIEPIDEQEIYGKHILSYPQLATSVYPRSVTHLLKDAVVALSILTFR